MATAESYVLAIGTKKGLWLATSPDRKDWSLSGPHFLMSEVPSIGIDTRDGRTRILVGVRSEHWGPTVFHSDDLGETWNEPEEGAIRFPEGTDAALERVWQIHPDAESRPGVVWAGCEPISVWKSTDGGEHFELNRGLWDHPHRTEWGAGYGGAAAHSIVVDHTGEKVHVAMSTGGVYRSLDGGSSWEPRNKGISAYFMPDPNPEFGQCVHKIAADAAVDGRLYAQNHHGVYRSDDDAESWESIAEGLPADFGFVMLTHPAPGRHRLGDPAQGGRREDPAGGQTGGPPDRRRRRELEAAGRRTAGSGIQLRAAGRRLRRRGGAGRRVLRHAWRQRLRQRRRGGTLRRGGLAPAGRAVRAGRRRHPGVRRFRGTRRRRERLRPVAGISVVLPSVLQPLAGGQSFLTAPADTTVTVEGVLDVVTGEYPALSRRLRDETGAIRRYVNIYVNGNEIRRLQGLATEVSPGQEVLIIQSVAGG